MPALTTNLRNDLGRSIVKARRVAEAGARKALESLAVERHEPHGSMSPEERALRNRLRAHGRQLGDVRDKQSGTQSIGRLTHEVAYEHWHRMLFARFLAENDLLIHPKHGVAVSLNEIEELARLVELAHDQSAVPREGRDVGDRVLVAAEEAALRHVPVEHIQLALPKASDQSGPRRGPIPSAGHLVLPEREGQEADRDREEALHPLGVRLHAARRVDLVIRHRS